ncbi:ATP-grasp domain-containing protein [Cellulomonas bogoriensis]|uniref:Biotin carboxylase n=1 Tax=Cellulomonas bogoriensis 69B4 = DSM 16987 TaxID=1386082 RepID=A0A0A0C3B9_9CELL|nr:ATP-grasp domain-containing protein [Cellulomonas bogoriensis]KGM13849.1 biotin carboxylase [Cellulomonas bogoriensis 69B4 = DSM 16987]
MRLLLIGFNSGVLTALAHMDDLRITVVEEPDLWEVKGLAAKVTRHPVVDDVRFARYQQDDHVLDVVADLAPTVDAVAPGLEYAVPAAARVAHRLGLPGAGPAAADLLRDKLELRRVTSAAGMPSPRFAEITSPQDIEAFAGGGPCVVKPANRQASLGVVLLDAGDDPTQAWEACTRTDEGRQVAKRAMRWRYMVEERLRGPEHSTECLVTDGTVGFLNVTAKATVPGRRPVELGHVVPSPDGEDPLWRDAVEQLVAATGFGYGMLHAEWVLVDGVPHLIECAGRPPGDHILDLVDLAYGTRLTQTWVTTLAGAPQGPPPPARRAAAIRFLTARPGVISSVTGADEAGAAPGVQTVEVTCTVGDRVGELTSSWDRCGSVIAVGDDPATATARAEQAAALLEVQVTPAAVPT